MVRTYLKHISKIGSFPQIGVNIKKLNLHFLRSISFIFILGIFVLIYYGFGAFGEFLISKKKHHKSTECLGMPIFRNEKHVFLVECAKIQRDVGSLF